MYSATDELNKETSTAGWRRRSRPPWRILDNLVLPSSVAGAEHAVVWCFWACSVCFQCFTQPYGGRGRQDDVADGGFELVDVRPVLMRAVVGLDGLDLHVKLPGLVLVLRVAGRIEGIVFGMLGESVKEKRDDGNQTNGCSFM